MSINVGGKLRGRGAEAVAEEKKKEEKSKLNPADYSCEILLEKTTLEDSKDKKFPTDAFNITYIVDGQSHLDVARSNKRVNLFDYYWDRYGNVKSIDYGHGTVNPSQWGYKKPEKKVRKKR
tara:strand:+ start:514 stop:876 length:363 start_codon:yes stop_codon:yes gene_type:complete